MLGGSFMEFHIEDNGFKEFYLADTTAILESYLSEVYKYTAKKIYLEESKRKLSNCLKDSFTDLLKCFMLTVKKVDFELEPDYELESEPVFGDIITCTYDKLFLTLIECLTKYGQRPAHKYIDDNMGKAINSFIQELKQSLSGIYILDLYEYIYSLHFTEEQFIDLISPKFKGISQKVISDLRNANEDFTLNDNLYVNYVLDCLYSEDNTIDDYIRKNLGE